jgi:hypothetical protein
MAWADRGGLPGRSQSGAAQARYARRRHAAPSFGDDRAGPRHDADGVRDRLRPRARSDPLAQLDSDIAAARPTAAASAAEAARSQALFAADATVSRKVAQAAAQQAGGDSARLSLLLRRLGLEWGPAITRLSDRQRGALVTSLSSGQSALVRIDSANGAGQAGLHTALLDLGGLGTASATSSARPAPPILACNRQA